jgi:thioredoxin reductase
MSLFEDEMAIGDSATVAERRSGFRSYKSLINGAHELRKTRCRKVVIKFRCNTVLRDGELHWVKLQRFHIQFGTDRNDSVRVDLME